MAPIQFYRINPEPAAGPVLVPAFRRRLSDSGPRRLVRRALAAVDATCARGGLVTLMAYDTGQGAFYATLNGEDPNRYGLAAETLRAAPRRPFRRPARGVPAALPGCLAAGMRVSTPDGCRAVEELRRGDRLTTLDGAPATLRWIGRATHVARGGFAPVTLRPGAFGAAGPAAPLSVSPLQPILLTGARAEIFFGVDEIMVPAGALPECALLEGAGPLDIVSYYTLLLDRQELIRAEGIWVASFHPADAPPLSFDAGMRAAVSAHHSGIAAGGVAAYGPRVRPMAVPEPEAPRPGAGRRQIVGEIGERLITTRTGLVTAASFRT